jgi:N-acylglucosamine 2-epimerase
MNDHDPTSTSMSSERADHLLAIYRDGLLNSTLPFWFPRSIDQEHGGFMFSRDRDGTLLDTDKAIWLHGRAAWLLATLYSEVEPRSEWLAWSRHGIDFLRQHGFDDDGRMFFLSRYQEVSVPFRLRPRPEPAPPSYR